MAIAGGNRVYPIHFLPFREIASAQKNPRRRAAFKSDRWRPFKIQMSYQNNNQLKWKYGKQLGINLQKSYLYLVAEMINQIIFHFSMQTFLNMVQRYKKWSSFK